MQKKSRNNHRKSARKSTSSQNEMQGGLIKALQSSLFGVGIALGFSLILMFVSAFICYSSSDPDKLITPLSLCSLYLPALAGGFAAVKKNKGSALACGGLCGALIVIILFFASLFLGSKAQASLSFPISLLVRALVILTSAAGGFLGLKKSSALHRRKR